MLTRDPDEGGPLCKLIDLGIAKVLKEGTGELTSTGMFLGKPRYASPEQLSAKGVDARSDLYSFGVVLYESLTGICPIDGNDPSSLMAGHLFRPPIDFVESDPYGRLPQELREILLRLLAKVPAERFASAEELVSRLSMVQGHFPVHPIDLDEVLFSSASPRISGLSSSGSTQERLDRQFVQAPTPARALMNESGSEPTAVLPTPSPPIPEEKTPSGDVTRESPRIPGVTPSSVQTTILSPARQGGDTRRMPPASQQRNRTPFVAALILLVVAAAGLGVWKLREPSASAASEESDFQKPEIGDSNTPESPSEHSSIGHERALGDTPAPSRSAKPTASAEAVRHSPTKNQPAINPDKSRRASQTLEQEPSHLVSESGDPSARQESPKPAIALPTPSDSAVPVQEDKPAQLLSLPPPAYPAEAKGTGSYARIIIAVRVDESGTVAGAQVESAYFESGASTGKNTPSLASSTFLQLYRKAALEAVRKARFEPAKRNGTPVPATTRLTIEFGKKRAG